MEIFFDLIGIYSETWIPEGNNLIQMENYKFLCNGRKNRKGGGIDIYLKEEFNYKIRKDLSIYDEDVIESLFIEMVNEKNKNIIVGVIYRAPDSDVKSSLKSFTEMTEKINLENKNCYLPGASTSIYSVQTTKIYQVNFWILFTPLSLSH